MFSARHALHAPAALLALLGGLAASQPASALSSTVTFDDLITGQTAYFFDGDGDGINDVNFSTMDPSGFNTIGPGLNQLYIHEPGLEGSSMLLTDLKVEFLHGATDSISFGFAINAAAVGPSSYASLRLYDANDLLLADSGPVLGGFETTPGGLSSFPEGRLSLSFAGVAAYGLFDFSSDNDFGRYIIDDFSGQFGSVVPEPSALLLLLLGLSCVATYKQKFST